MSTITVTAKTLDLALIRAAGQLGISSDKVGHNVKLESSGFLGMGKKIIIEAWNKADRKASGKDKGPRKQRRNKSDRNERTERSSDRNERSARPSRRNDRQERAERSSDENREKVELTAEQKTELVEELRGFLAGMVELSMGETIEVTATESEERLVLNIESDFLAKQFAKNSKLAESFEHLLRKKPRHLRQELPFRVFVDADNVRVSRETELSEMAKELSDKVFNQNKPVVLNYRSSYDRKVIHMALDKDDRVYTKSIGKGPNRKLMILPTKDADEQGAR